MIFIVISLLTLTSSDPEATLCHPSLHAPRGSIQKPQCAINPFLPYPSSFDWAASLTESGLSPIYLQADWFKAAVQGLDRQLVVSSVMRAPTATKEPSGKLSEWTGARMSILLGHEIYQLQTP